MNTHVIELTLKKEERDPLGENTAKTIKKVLGIDCGVIRTSKVFFIRYDIDEKTVSYFARDCFLDPVINDIHVGKLPQIASSFVSVANLPGVTDDEGMSAQKMLADYLGRKMDTRVQHIFTQYLYLFEKEIDEEKLKTIATSILGNPLINHFEYGKWINKLEYVPEVHMRVDNTVNVIDLNVSDERLLEISDKMVLSLNLEEIKTVQAYYSDKTVAASRVKRGLPPMPTDCEIEVIAQTWSEHCKHKEFAGVIDYIDKESGQRRKIDSLFKTYIRGATEKVAESLAKKNNNWLVKVFTDNAGVVRINESKLFVWKVETHNSPSAIDPYGGAITGILGNNRDPLGTGVGGGRLLFNTNVLCFGDPEYSGELLPGQLHPRRIMEGVVKGIEDGGNKSGIPTVNGSIVFDDRYAGKPLVYCGTGGVLPASYGGRPSWEKPIDSGDRIIMGGGRVGKDGIHGATFSSVEISESSPQSAVQIGSPITQKLFADFLERATVEGLVKCSTDNGAGGLSSSIGELAQISGGAIVDLDRVPLKYSGLKPWEIFVSESQERMSLVVEQNKMTELFALADKMDVELSDIGEFTADGYLDIRFENKTIAYLPLEFLHEGVPRKYMSAEWTPPRFEEPEITGDAKALLLKLMGSLNICSKEDVIRRYDHEVKGKTLVKPLMGNDGTQVQDAAVVRVDFDSYTGIAVSNGILPRYGDIDAYEMSAGSFDEAVRAIIAVGGSLPNTADNDGIFWSVNDNFCVPDSVYDEKKNPDGKYKMAQLVRICEACYDMATYFDIPLTSGKDSMKNDFKMGGKKISVPPTILYSMAAKIDDVRNCVTSGFKAEGDLVYILGETYDEMGCSELYRLFGKTGNTVPRVRKETAKDLYLRVMKANRNRLIESCHDLSDGGLAVALAECILGTDLGVSVSLDAMGGDMTTIKKLFSESHSRFIVSVRPQNKDAFEKIFETRACHIGHVDAGGIMRVADMGAEIFAVDRNALSHAHRSGLEVH